ncbi:DUF1642 domain-containing protein [Enterococcus faecium]|nr:DUF1642 domain-containing protein [Enterococcus faecium]EME8143846.1 DUF1642 domain-containing protein [Enterococcus faecium]EMF0431034.1 DUF1642 domain-containing protein [Enterococcus faecium]
MNKLEAIKELEGLKTIGNDARAACYNEGINAGITIIKQLDEPQKPVVPKFVAEYFNYCIANERTLAEALSGLDKDFKVPDYLYPAIKWLEDSMNQDIFAQAWLIGYEVEKVQKYIVKIGKLYLKEPLGDTSNFTILTTWDKKRAYPFSSFNTADKHADKFKGAVIEVAEG